jgi:hypothetical protein
MNNLNAVRDAILPLVTRDDELIHPGQPMSVADRAAAPTAIYREND